MGLVLSLIIDFSMKNTNQSANFQDIEIEKKNQHQYILSYQESSLHNFWCEILTHYLFAHLYGVFSKIL